MSIETEMKPAIIPQTGSARVRWPALAAALFAGLSAWVSGELSGVYQVTIPAHLIGKIGAASSEQVRIKAAAEDRGATFAFTVLGLALGLALGGAGGLARGSAPSALKAGALGAVVGAGAAYGILQALLPLFHRFLVQLSDSVLVPMQLHGVLWGAIGAAGGLAYGWGLRGPRALARPLLGGLGGALVGAFAFELIGVLMFTTSGTTQALPTTPIARLFAMLTLALSVAAGASWFASAPATTSSGPPTAPGASGSR
jgi:hypothetical protein